MPSVTVRRARAAEKKKDALPSNLGLTLGVASTVVVVASIAAIAISAWGNAGNAQLGTQLSSQEHVEAELNRLDAQWEEIEKRVQDTDDKYLDLKAKHLLNSQEEEAAMKILESGDERKKNLEQRLSAEDRQLDSITKKLKDHDSQQSSLMVALDTQNELELRLRREIEELTRQQEDLETALRLAEATNPGPRTADGPK